MLVKTDDYWELFEVYLMSEALFQLIDRQALGEMLKTLNCCIDLPVQLLDEKGAQLSAFGENAGFCTLLGRCAQARAACASAHFQAGQRAQTLGRSYIFTCHGNLNHIAFPLTNCGQLLGSVLAGPFLMDEADSTLVGDVVEKYDLSSIVGLELYDELRALTVIAPSKVEHVARLMEYLLLPLFPAERAAREQRQQTLYQQSRINETIQVVKRGGAHEESGYPYELEKELLVKVKTGNVNEAKGVLNELLGYVLFCEGGRIETMKNRALELSTLLSRVAIEGGALTDAIYRLNNQFLSQLSAIGDMEQLCYRLQMIVESFMSAMFSGDGHGGAVRKAVTYIAEHYAQPLTLEVVAGAAGLSPSYFSALFRKHMGIGLKEYIGKVRIEESKRLLSATDYALVDIALAMGFSDQSYYAKVFKKQTGLTPSQYRA